MPKKKPSNLPPIDGSSPRSPPWSAQSTGSAVGYREKDERRVSWDEDAFEKLAQAKTFKSLQGLSQSEPSTAGPLDMSRDEARGISMMLDDSLHAASGKSAAPATVNAGDNWEVQSPDEIIGDVTQYVHAKKPWRRKLDDSFLEHKHNDRLDRLERGFHIILPDNRVRVMEDELSFRVRCLLQDVDPEDALPPPQPRRPENSKPKNNKMRQNPWYLKPRCWYDKTSKDNPNAESTEKSNDFPYANTILNVPGGEPKMELTPLQKENIAIVEPYKAWMKKDGHRLPHFLQ